MSSTAGEEKRTDVAIIGGGFGGLALAIGLQKYAHIRVQVYEGAHRFSEVGAGIVLGPNAQRAMKLIDPRISEGYERRAAKGNPQQDEQGLYTWMTMYKGQEPDFGELLARYKNPMRGSTMHRAHFLEELVKLVEPGTAVFGKRVDRIDEPADDSPIKLHFGDGTTATADIVIGADGVHSYTRRHVLGADDPAANAIFTGCVIYRAVVPMERAMEALGSDMDQAPGVRCGQNAMVIGFPMANRTMYNIAVTVINEGDWKEKTWNSPANVGPVKARFHDWHDVVQRLVSLLPDDGSTLAWSVWDMPPARTYAAGRVAIMGDAAHATTPHQGAGAGQAIEDALVLEQLLGKYLDPKNRTASPSNPLRTVPLLLNAYDTVRRFRSQKVVTTSREVAYIMTGHDDFITYRAEEIRAYLKNRQDWIWDLDQERQVTDAFQIFESSWAANERAAAAKKSS